MSAATAPAPTPLRVAAGVAALEAVALLVLAVLQLVSLSADRLALGTTTAAFFVAFGALVLVCARALLGRHTWARGPVLLTQLILLGLAWNFRDDPVVAVVLALVGAAGLAGLVHPATIEALGDGPGPASGPDPGDR